MHRVLYEGVANGGPLDQLTVNSRYQGGFIAVDVENGESWVYRHMGSTFIAQRDDSYAQDRDKLQKAASSVLFDVRSI